MQNTNINDLPRDLLVYLLGFMCSYERSRVCPVSKLFEFAAIFASKNQSSHKLYYEDPSIFRKLCSKLYRAQTQKTQKYNDIDLNAVNKELIIAVQQMIWDFDYHLFVRLKSDYIVRHIQTASRHGYFPVINLMVKIAEPILYYKDRVVFDALCGSCEGGHLELSKTMFSLIKHSFVKDSFTSEHLEKNPEVNISDEIDDMVNSDHRRHCVFYCAGVGGNKLVIDMLCEEFALLDVEIDDYTDSVFVGACDGGKKDLVEWIMQQNIILSDSDFTDGFGEACKNGHLDIVKVLKDKVIKINDGDLSALDLEIVNAFERGNIEIIEYLKENNLITDWNWMLGNACRCNQQKAVVMAINGGAEQCENCLLPTEAHISKNIDL